MSRQTTNYGLTKPDYTDTADIEVVNANMDIIDGALKVIDTKSNNVMSKNSSVWSSTVTYAVGQYCIYNNSLWKSLVQHSGQTPQEGTYWARVSLDILDSEINALNSNLTMSLLAYDNVTNASTSIEYDVYNNRAGIYIQIMSVEFSDTKKIKGYPKGLYGYGTLITIIRQAGLDSVNQWMNVQIYIPQDGKMVYRTLVNSKWQCVDGTTVEIQR